MRMKEKASIGTGAAPRLVPEVARAVSCARRDIISEVPLDPARTAGGGGAPCSPATASLAGLAGRAPRNGAPVGGRQNAPTAEFSAGPAQKTAPPNRAAPLEQPRRVGKK